MFYLGVKWIFFQIVLALELQGICLGHHQGVLSPLKDLSLIDLIRRTSREVSLFDHCHPRHPFPVAVFTESRCLLLVCVVVHNLWQPQLSNVIRCESIQ